MKKFFAYSMLGLACLTNTTTFAKTTDWTPYVEFMKHGCGGDYFSYYKIITLYDGDLIEKIEAGQLPNPYTLSQKELNKRIPKHLRESIHKITLHNGSLPDTSNTYYYTFHFNNATAFGFPITKLIHSVGGAAHGGTRLYFNDSHFMQLRPQFYTTIETKSGKEETIYAHQQPNNKNIIFNKVNANDGSVILRTYYIPAQTLNAFLSDLKKYHTFLNQHQEREWQDTPQDRRTLQQYGGLYLRHLSPYLNISVLPVTNDGFLGSFPVLLTHTDQESIGYHLTYPTSIGYVSRAANPYQTYSTLIFNAQEQSISCLSDYAGDAIQPLY